jgi:hypothetical protein
MCISTFHMSRQHPLCRLPQYRGTKLYVYRHREPLGLGYPQSLWSALCRHARSLPHSSISECSLGACNDSNH